MIRCESEIYSVSAIDEDFPITAKDIGKTTVLDPFLSRVLDFVMTGWPEKCDEEELKPYHISSQELSFDTLEVGYPTLPAHSHRSLSKGASSIFSRDR